MTGIRTTFVNAMMSLALLLPSVAQAVPLEVHASFVRPAWFLDDSPGADACGDLTTAPDADGFYEADRCLRDPEMNSGTRHWVPASLQRVRVYQTQEHQALIGPYLCGTLYTDLAGVVEGQVDCKNDVDIIWLEVEGVSLRGFEVGTFDYGGVVVAAITIAPFLVPFVTAAVALSPTVIVEFITLLAGTAAWLPIVKDFFERTHVYRWAVPAGVPSSEGIVDADLMLPPGAQWSLGMGRTGNAATNGDWAAALMEGVTFMYPLLGGQDPARVGPIPDVPYSKWIINNPFFGTPTSFWNTLHINQDLIRDEDTGDVDRDALWPRVMGSIPHEMGHVIYNFHHSDRMHYYNELHSYMKNHSACGNPEHGDGFANYEGFAEAVSVAVWSGYAARHEVRTGSDIDAGVEWRFPTPGAGCSNGTEAGDGFGFEYEGNVTSFYAALLTGTRVVERVLVDDEEHLVRTGDSAKPEELWTLSLPELYSAIETTGSNQHRTRDVWTSALREICEDSESSYYCGSKRFRCYVSTVLSRPGQAENALFGGDCMPGAEEIESTSAFEFFGSPAVEVIASETTYADRHLLRHSPVAYHESALTHAIVPATATDVARWRFSIDACQTYSMWIQTELDDGSVTPGPDTRYTAAPIGEGSCTDVYRFGDFDRDGIDDVFRVDDLDGQLQWRYWSSASGDWIDLNWSNVPIEQLRFGDFDGDGRTDVFSVTSRARGGFQWRYSSGGASAWQDLNWSDAPLTDLRFGDFDGDGRTDVFSVDRSGSTGQWRYSSGGVGAWQNLKSASVSLENLRFADFDGDGRTDVFKVINGAQGKLLWRYASAGLGKWRRLGWSTTPLADLRFGDFDGDGKDDVFSVIDLADGRHRWRYSSGGVGSWVGLGWSYDDIDDLRFGNFDSDDVTDVFSTVTADGGLSRRYSSAGSSNWRPFGIN